MKYCQLCAARGHVTDFENGKFKFPSDELSLHTSQSNYSLSVKHSISYFLGNKCIFTSATCVTPLLLSQLHHGGTQTVWEVHSDSMECANFCEIQEQTFSWWEWASTRTDCQGGGAVRTQSQLERTGFQQPQLNAATLCRVLDKMILPVPFQLRLCWASVKFSKIHFPLRIMLELIGKYPPKAATKSMCD